MSHYAHTKSGSPPAEWQRLEDHLGGVATLASELAGKFSRDDWGHIAGLWHDLGKYSDAFQLYLSTASEPDSHVAETSTRIDHSTAGAQHAVEAFGTVGHLLAYVISGHHSGLLDGRSEGASLEKRLKKSVEAYQHGLEAIPTCQAPEPRNLAGSEKGADAVGHQKAAFRMAFFTRMLFSCLVDADFRDTERFMRPDDAAARPMWPVDVLARIERELNRYVDTLGKRDGEVFRQRGNVRRACISAAESPPGLFSLTVPTGGGKTLSSLAFALRHAIRHRLSRVIYVIPFTSIIEQTAARFREATAELSTELGVDVVLEHHSNLDVGQETVTSRLSVENWDCPIVVTTSVQFYESLFANRTSRCRKLHNLVQSVVILDEVQTLPVDLLEPCLRSLEELVRGYGATVVLCTATQPAVHQRAEFPIGLEGVSEIIKDPESLYESLRRVEVLDIGSVPDEELVERLRSEPQVLCIVNTRRHAQRLFEMLGPGDEHLHLSALLCPAHRAELIKTIPDRLAKGGHLRLIATRLIEAGVDIDFPVVYRSLAGLDSVAQAAGRCNRNGDLDLAGTTYVFRSEHERAERFLRETANVSAELLGLVDDPLSLDAVERYFRLYYWNQKDRWDAKQIMGEFHLAPNSPELPFLFSFATVAGKFKLIEETGKPVIIPWGAEGRSACEALRARGEVPSARLLRRLQRYAVQVPKRLWDQHVNRSFTLIHERYAVLDNLESHYDPNLGLNLEDGFDTVLMS